MASSYDIRQHEKAWETGPNVMHQQVEITDEKVIEQAIMCANRSDWTVLFADCRVQRMATDPRTPDAAADAWTVFMWAQPFYNQQLRKVMPLGCQVQLLDGRLCAVNLYEPSDRLSYLQQTPTDDEGRP